MFKTLLLPAAFLICAQTANAQPATLNNSYPVVITVGGMPTPVNDSVLRAAIINAQAEVDRATDEFNEAKGTILQSHGYPQGDDYEFAEHPELKAELVPFEKQLRTAQKQLQQAQEQANLASQMGWPALYFNTNPVVFVSGQ